MGLKTREVLAVLKRELEAIQPSLGRVHATLRMSPDQDTITTDWAYDDPAMGKIIKAFIVKPGTGRENRATTGNLGFAVSAQNYVIQGLLSWNTEKGAADQVLEDAFDAIRERLRKLTRLQDKSQGDAFFSGEMDWGAIGVATLGGHKLLVKELTLAVQDRKT